MKQKKKWENFGSKVVEYDSSKYENDEKGEVNQGK